MIIYYDVKNIVLNLIEKIFLFKDSGRSVSIKSVSSVTEQGQISRPDHSLQHL